MNDQQPTPVQPTPTTTPPGAPRLTCHDDVIQRATQFSTDLLRLVPEVEAVAVIPSFTIPQDHFPYGIILGRHGPLRSPAEIMHMATQLHGTLRTQLDAAFRVLQTLDTYMGERKAYLQQLEEQISERQRQCNQLDAQAGQQSTGAPTGEATPPGNPHQA